jgi:IS30 family transposase
MSGQRRYFRLTRAERASVERSLDGREGARSVARGLGRSASSVSEEVRRNRTVAKGPGRGERVGGVPDDACPRLTRWPWTCNGCRYRRYHCTRAWRCEYSAARAQRLSDELRSDSRRGVDMGEAEAEAEAGMALAAIRADIARGLSPAQIARARADELGMSASTIYRWVEAGYGGMSNAELRRKVGYRARRHGPQATPTAHGQERSYAAFSALPEEERACACEMDTVVGRSADTRCILTLYLRPARFQLAMCLPRKTSSAVAAALDSLEAALGREGFQRLFGLLLTDNGTEFADTSAIEASRGGGRARTRVYYCDVRMSQQKAGCERNHVELRKLLPKGRGIAFDLLDDHDMACVMSQLDSEPRPSLGGMTPTRMLRAAYGPLAEDLMDALGVEDVPYEALDLTLRAVEDEREERGGAPLL